MSQLLWIEMSATMVNRRWKILQKYWLKRSKGNPSKMKTGHELKIMIQNLIFGIHFFFQKYYFGHTTFLYLSRRSSWHHQSFFPNFTFSSRKSQNKQKLAKKITHFTIQFRSTILRTSTHLTFKIISFRNTAKSLSDFTNFPADMFLFGVGINIALHPFLTPNNCILEALWTQISLYFYISP